MLRRPVGGPGRAGAGGPGGPTAARPGLLRAVAGRHDRGGHTRSRGRLLDAFEDAGVGLDRLAVHFHDTYGQALANTLAALRRGITVVDASTGGIGGCPYAKSATGNLATEDLVWMLDGLGVETGVDVRSLAVTSLWLADILGRPSPSRVVQALAKEL